MVLEPSQSTGERLTVLRETFGCDVISQASHPEITLSSFTRLADQLVRVLDVLESPEHFRPRVWTGIAGTLLTGSMWVLHLSHPSLLIGLHGVAEKFALLIIFAPAFLTVLTIGFMLFPDVISHQRELEPMASYLQRERAVRRWKIMVGAGIISVANYFLMLVTSHAVQ